MTTSAALVSTAQLAQNLDPLLQFMTGSFFTHGSVRQIAEEITRSVAEALELPNCSIHLMDKSGQRLVRQARYVRGDIAPAIPPMPSEINVGIGLIGCTAATSEPHLIASPRNVPPLIALRESIASALAVPILHAERLIGVISSETVTPDFFTSHHKHIFIEIAAQASRHLHQAQQNEYVFEAFQSTTALQRQSKDHSDGYVAKAGHDLRGQLHTMQLLLQAIENGVYGAITKKQEEKLVKITKSGQDMLSIIDEFVDRAKHMENLLNAVYSPIRLDELCDVSLTLAQPIAYERQIYTIKFLPELSKEIKGVEEALRRALIGLLNLVILNTPRNGRIGIQLEENKEKNLAKIEIWGGAQATQNMQALFEALKTAKEQPDDLNNAGQTLWSAINVIKAHDGDIFLFVTDGYRFEINLPLPT